ncbi:MAG: divergent PAP2 family protein [Spirochaetaceae bacterium]|nr:divergent PAP2 family protein [Spirochaetaceae bacterium]
MNGATRPMEGDLFHNPIFLSAVCSLLVAQFLKVVINLFKFRTESFREVLMTFLWKTGGMPSSHSALAVSIATAIAYVEGANTSIFVLALFFALVVIRDAMGVRRSAGIQARTLNQLGKSLSGRIGIPYHPVKEVQGHSPPQVVVGSLLGFFIALAFCTL